MDLVGSVECGGNFREFTPRSKMRIAVQPSVENTQNFTKCLLIVHTLLWYGQPIPLWTSFFNVYGAHSSFLHFEDCPGYHWSWITPVDEDYLLWITISCPFVHRSSMLLSNLPCVCVCVCFFFFKYVCAHNGWSHHLVFAMV